MNILLPSIKRHVLVETALVSEIMRLSSGIKSADTVARLCGCSRNYVYMVRTLKRSRARVWVSWDDHKEYKRHGYEARA